MSLQAAMEGSSSPTSETGVDAAAGCAACSDACGAAASTSAMARESGLNTDADMVFSLRFSETRVLRNRRVAEQEAGESLRRHENGRRCETRRPFGQRYRGTALSTERRASPERDLLVVSANHPVDGLQVAHPRAPG